MIHTLQHLCFVIKSSPEELNNVTSDIDSYYYEKIEVKRNKDGTPKLDGKGNAKTRILNPSKGILKHLQSMVLENVLQQIPMPDYAFGAMKGKDNVMNAKRHQGKKFIFTTDLKDFFPGITHRMVFAMFRAQNFSPTIAKMLTHLTTYKGHLPQGAPTSPMMANLVFMKTADKLNEIARAHGITFTSFIDDLTFSSGRDFKSLTGILLKVITNDRFRLSHGKTNYKTKDPMVTGVMVRNNNVALPKAFKAKMLDTTLFTKEQVEGLKQYAKKIEKANH